MLQIGQLGYRRSSGGRLLPLAKIRLEAVSLPTVALKDKELTNVRGLPCGRVAGGGKEPGRNTATEASVAKRSGSDDGCQVVSISNERGALSPRATARKGGRRIIQTARGLDRGPPANAGRLTGSFTTLLVAFFRHGKGAGKYRDSLKKADSFLTAAAAVLCGALPRQSAVRLKAN
jgi:hypothetical protein